MYAVFRTNKFDKEFSKRFSTEEQKEVENFERKQLTANPAVGDPLGYLFFREKKVGGKRVYYLIYDDLHAVLIVGISDKKTQQETINEVIRYLPEFKEYITKLLKKN